MFMTVSVRQVNTHTHTHTHVDPESLNYGTNLLSVKPQGPLESSSQPFKLLSAQDNLQSLTGTNTNPRQR